nr:signal peptidase I [Microbacterium excoecariae]
MIGSAVSLPTRAHSAVRAAGAGPARHAAAGPGAADRARDVLVWILGAAGALAVAWLLAAWAFGLQLVVLTTGSMSPGMPPGTAVVTETVRADELEVGDVVSAPRAYDERLVTHRIVAIDAGDTADERVLTLRGDANEEDDAQAYHVTQAQRAVVAVPGLGYAVSFLGTPQGITVLAVVIPAAALWVLWPSRS